MKRTLIFLGLFICCAAIPRGFSAQTDKVRDPFQSKLPIAQQKAMQSAGQPQPITAVLYGLSRGPKGAYAIINGELYEEGKEKNGIKVTQIRKREVDILINNIPMTLKMVPDDLGAEKEEAPKVNKIAKQVNESALRNPCGPGQECG